MNVSVTVTKRGGVFTAGASGIVDRYHQEMMMDTATAGTAMVRQRLQSVLKHPTGYYSSQIRERSTGNGAEVTDSGVIYGPWLEGTSRRNQTSRFKGYATFRRTAQDLEKAAPKVAGPAADKLAARLR